MVEHIEPDRRRQIALITQRVDIGDHFRKRHIARRSDFLQRVPKCIFEADAGLMPRDDNRTLHYRALDHDPSPDSMRRPSRSRSRFSSIAFSVRLAASVRPYGTRFSAARFASSSRAFALRRRLRLMISPITLPSSRNSQTKQRSATRNADGNQRSEENMAAV